MHLLVVFDDAALEVWGQAEEVFEPKQQIALHTHLAASAYVSIRQHTSAYVSSPRARTADRTPHSPSREV